MDLEQLSEKIELMAYRNIRLIMQRAHTSCVCNDLNTRSYKSRMNPVPILFSFSFAF